MPDRRKNVTENSSDDDGEDARRIAFKWHIRISVKLYGQSESNRNIHVVVKHYKQDAEQQEAVTRRRHERQRNADPPISSDEEQEEDMTRPSTESEFKELNNMNINHRRHNNEWRWSSTTENQGVGGGARPKHVSRPLPRNPDEEKTLEKKLKRGNGNQFESTDHNKERDFGKDLRHVETSSVKSTMSSKNYAHDFGVKLRHVDPRIKSESESNQAHDFGVNLQHVEPREQVEGKNDNRHDFGVKLKRVESAERGSRTKRPEVTNDQHVLHVKTPESKCSMTDNARYFGVTLGSTEHPRVRSGQRDNWRYFEANVSESEPEMASMPADADHAPSSFHKVPLKQQSTRATIQGFDVANDRYVEMRRNRSKGSSGVEVRGGGGTSSEETQLVQHSRCLETRNSKKNHRRGLSIG